MHVQLQASNMQTITLSLVIFFLEKNGRRAHTCKQLHYG
jgi:hypothetical protein